MGVIPVLHLKKKNKPMHGPTHQERLSSVVFLALFFFSPFFGRPSKLVDA